MRLIIIGLALFMFSCSQNFSEDLIESCESVELRTCSGTVLDYYTEEPIPKARIKLIDFTPEGF